MTTPARERILDLLETYCGEWLSADQISLMLSMDRASVGKALARMPSRGFEVRSIPTERGNHSPSVRREYRIKVRSYL